MQGVVTFYEYLIICSKKTMVSCKAGAHTYMFRPFVDSVTKPTTSPAKMLVLPMVWVINLNSHCHLCINKG